MLLFGDRWALSNKPEQEATPLQSGPFLEVMTRQHTFDAHAYTYQINPPIRIWSGSPLKDEALFHTAWLDFDQSNDHVAILQAFQKLPETSPAARAAVIYPTLSGMRFVYCFEQPVLVHEYGPLVRGLAIELSRHTGLNVDPSTDQWSRSFRLPCVTRADGKANGPTWLQGYWFEPILVDATIKAEEVAPWAGRLPWDTRGRTLETSTGPAPTGVVPQHRLTTYKRALKANRFFSYLFEHDVIPEGRRDQTLLAIASEVVARCFKGVTDSTVEEIFGLVVSVTDSFTRDGSESWTDKAWRMVQHCWNGEVQKEQERQNRERQEMSLRDQIVNRMLQWIPEESVPTDPVERRLFIERHYCLQTATGAFVVQRTGEYSKAALKTSQLPAHFNDGLHCLTDDGFRNKNGGLLSGQTILNHFSTNLDEVEYLTGEAPSVKLFIENERRVLRIVPFALRPDLLEAAEFDQEVGEWLETFRDADLLKRWLAASLALHIGPVASCYLNGPARVGKSMLAVAIAECFHCQPVPAAQAFSDFNGMLLQSPVIMIDEGLPTRITGLDTADLFRSLVTGAPISTQKKFQDQVNTKFQYRLIFAANSFDMVKKLIGKRTMDLQDREALRERILVIETGKGPADYLDSRGAMTFTKYSKKGAWLGKECRLARHIMKLYLQAFEEQEFVSDGRLLVEGRPHPAFTLAFDLSGAGRDVVDDLTTDVTLILTKKALNQPMLMRALAVEKGGIWLKKRPYIKLKCERAPARAEQYSTALDRFLMKETKTAADLSTQVRVDLEKLVFCAQIEGLDSTKLDELRLQQAGVS